MQCINIGSHGLSLTRIKLVLLSQLKEVNFTDQSDVDGRTFGEIRYDWRDKNQLGSYSCVVENIFASDSATIDVVRAISES